MKKFLLLLCLFSGSIFGQNNYDVFQFIDETPKFAFNIKNWDSSDYLKLGAVTISTASLMLVDDEVRTFLRNNNLNKKNVVLEFGKAWGEPISTIPISAGFYFYGMIANDMKSKKIGFEIFQSFVYTGAVTAILKSAFGRARPYKNLSSNYYKPFTIKNDFNSLPSGHTSVAFSLSTVLANNIENDYLKAVAFTPAFITAFSRMSYDKHWLSDVFLAAAIGYVVGNFVTDIHAEIGMANETNLGQSVVITKRFSIN